MALNEAAKKWVEALRSGKYRQGKRQLRNGDQFCCLGVAEELALADGVISTYCHEAPALDCTTQSWLGLTTDCGKFDGFGCYLTNMNDMGDSFEKIAAVIESEPKGLFRGAVPAATGASDSEHTK